MMEKMMKRLLAVAQGHKPPDAVIRNGKVINVFTNEIEEGLSLFIKDGWIVSLEKDGKRPAAKGTKEIDAKGMYLCPGFIDAHTHLDSLYRFSELPPYALRGGTTTIVSESGMVGTACGYEGVLSFVESTKGYPLRCYFLAPPLTPPYPKLERALGLTLKEFSKLLRRDDFVGIGEGYWTGVLDGGERTLKQASQAMTLRKTLEGHSSGARGNRLMQYLLTGITSCHESVSLEEALEKLRLGVYVMIREGFVRKELKELSKLKDLNIDTRRMILVSDLFDPVMLVEEGYMDSVVRRAVEYGFAPIDAIKMATINPADYYGLRFLGALAPLRRADILFLSSLKKVSVEKVMFNGKMVFAGGRFTEKIAPNHYPKRMQNTLSLKKVTLSAFAIKAKKGKNTVRVEELVNETIAKEFLWSPPVKDGILLNDAESDIAYAAVMNRHNEKQMGKGFVKGTGIKHGAVATTLIWDTCNVLVVGSGTKDMEAAVNRLVDMQGGIAIAQGGKIIYELPMPVYGLIPLNKMTELRDKIKALDEAMKAIGSTIKRPFLTLQIIPFTGLPFLKITDRGLADTKTRRLVPLFVKGS